MTSAEIKNEMMQDFSTLKSDRGTLEQHWEEAACIASPRDAVFNTKRTPGQKLRQNQYDTKAERALDRATAFYGSILTPRDQQWHKLATTNPELNRIHAVNEWFDLATEALFHWRYRPRASFAVQNHEEHRSLLAWGNSCLFTGSSFDLPFWYKAMHMSEIYWRENQQNQIDTVYRSYEMTKRQLVQEYGEKNIPKSVMQKKPDDKMNVLHLVTTNDDWQPDSLDPLKRKYISRHMLTNNSANLEEGNFLREGGFFTFPYACTRDSRSPGEPYGRGTLEKILPDIKMSNQMSRTYIRIGQFHSDPVNLLRDDSSIDTVDLRPGRDVVGGLDSKGNPTIAPYNGGGSWEINVEMMDRQGRIIEEAFLLDMFLAQGRFEGRERVTATEVLEFTREQGRLETPLAGRSETEARSPQIEREVQIAMDMELLPPMPGELIEANGEFEIQFTNPLSLAQKSDQAIGAINTVDQAMEKAQVDPSVLDNIDFDQYISIIHEAQGAQAKLLRDPEEVAALRQARQQQQEQEQLMANAGGMGSAVKDLAEAEQTAKQ